MPYTDKAVDCCHRCESGRQDSNLRPLVPQTSTYSWTRSRVEKGWFRRELVGVTTRAGAMESGRWSVGA
jgi:hypothetical protein